MSSFDSGSEQYFWEDGYYRYKNIDGSKFDGTYKCVNNKLYINIVSENGQIFYDGKWKTLIEDEDLLDTIKKGGVIVDIIKEKFLNLLDVSKAWTFEKIEELKKWWKEHKKNQNNKRNLEPSP
jgi:ribosomal protein S15P/S13E